jgi:serpin B
MKSFVLVFALLLLSANFSEAQGPIRRILDRLFNRAFKADDSRATVEAVSAVIKANNMFAFDLYQEISPREGNLFFSPYSISSALAMTYEGAGGETAEAIRDVFHFPETEVLRNGYARLYNEMRAVKEYEMNVANALWVQKNYALLENYLDIMRRYYGGSAENVDFARDPEGSRKIINQWVEEQTKERIKDLIPPGIITPLTALVITNAIYFKGMWALQFDEGLTRKSDFRTGENKSVEVDMMSLPDQSF